MAKKIDDGKSQIVLIAAIIIIAAVMIFGMFSKGGKDSEKSAGKAKNVKISQNNGKKSSKTKKSMEIRLIFKRLKMENLLERC